MKNIKIFVSYHKQSPLIKNEILEPIHAGRDINSSEWLKKNMIGDNTDDNISKKNDRYCELTIQYFIWKNIDKFADLDYIGFCHYRRIFSFKKNIQYQENNHMVVEYPFVNKDMYETFGLNKQCALDAVEDYDITTIKPTNVKRIRFKNNFLLYKNSPNHEIKDYKSALKILLEKYPEYKEAVKKYNNSDFGYYTNSFIMKREEFLKYSEWLFSILFEAEKDIPIYKNSYKNRVMGFIAERLFGIYVTYRKLRNYKIQELQQVFIESAEDKNYIPIAFACNNNYVLPLCSAINSILKNANKKDYFFFYILNSKKYLNYINKRLITRMSTENCKIKFVSVDERLFKTLPQTNVCTHISIETYYRYMLPTIFNYLNKILYLDCDITVLSDLKKLYDIDIDKYYFAGVEDILSKDSEKRLNINKYCNAGVLLFNLKRLREENLETKLFEYTIQNKDKIIWQDQDVINTVLQNGIKYIDKKWNAQVGEYEHCYTSGFNKIGEKASILHHIGCTKPWMPQSKSPFKQKFMDSVNSLPTILRLIKYNTPLFIFFIILSFTYIKRKRKQIITYNKRTRELILLNKYVHKIK